MKNCFLLFILKSIVLLSLKFVLLLTQTSSPFFSHFRVLITLSFFFLFFFWGGGGVNVFCFHLQVFIKFFLISLNSFLVYFIEIKMKQK